MRRGFTLIEIILTMGVVATLLVVSSINLLSSQRKSSLTSTLDILYSDLREQQMKAMSSGTTAQGIYFSQNYYVLFNGTAYDPDDSGNFTVELSPNQQFIDITFPIATISFLPKSGEISGFIPGNNSVTLVDAQENQSYAVTLNAYGVVTAIN
jgi:prepilin-type N-terminal cleavage/methylation domain-containing protein